MLLVGWAPVVVCQGLEGKVSLQIDISESFGVLQQLVFKIKVSKCQRHQFPQALVAFLAVSVSVYGCVCVRVFPTSILVALSAKNDQIKVLKANEVSLYEAL